MSMFVWLMQLGDILQIDVAALKCDKVTITYFIISYLV